MRKKTILGIIIMMSLLVIAEPLPTCEANREIKTYCTMLTPTLRNCPTYNYTIIKSNGTILEEANLTNLQGDVYYFNFTQGKGDYIVRLCDLTTREIRVKEDDEGKMIIAVTMLIPFIFGLFMMWLAVSLDKETHKALRAFLMLLTFASFYAGINYSIVSVNHFYDFPALENLLGSTTNWTGWVFYSVLAYFLLYLMYIGFSSFMDKKKARHEY